MQEAMISIMRKYDSNQQKKLLLPAISIPRHKIHLPDQILGSQIPRQVGQLLLILENNHIIFERHFGVPDLLK